MPCDPSPLVILGTVNAAIALASAWWIRLHRPLRGLQSFMALLLCVAGWSAADALERLAATLPGKLLWAQVGYLFAITAPVAFLAFVLRFVPPARDLSNRQIALLSLEPLLTLVLVLTNQRHGLLWSDFALHPTVAGVPLLVEHGPCFWIHAAYSYLLAGLALFWLLRSLRTGSPLLRRQGYAMVVAAVSAGAGVVLSLGLPQLYGLPLVLGLTLTNATLILNLFRYGLFQLVPVARATVFEQMDAAALVLDEAGRVVDINPRAEQLLGRASPEVIGQRPSEALPEQRSLFAPWRDRVQWHGELHGGEGRQRKLYDVQVSPLRDERGGVRGRVAVLRDVTAMRRAQQRVQEGVLERQRLEGVSEQRRLYLESVLHSVPDAIVTLDHQHCVQEWNRGAEELFGYTAVEVQGRDLDELVTGAHGEVMREARVLTEMVLDGREVPPHEATRYRKDGKPVEVIVAGSPILLQGQHLGVVVAYRDISELKAVQQRLRTSLREKEILLKEVHHRVKNNLQVVSSLLYLQAVKAGEGPAAVMLQDSLNRVRSMAMVHEQLYGSHDLARIDLSEYLRRLSASLLDSYAPQSGQVQVEVDVQDISLAVDQAIPCGLIVTELVSNALRHAFPQGQGGRIYIHCADDGDGRYRVEVSDDGVGLPERPLYAGSDTLGLELVDMLVEQLHGHMEVERNQGTRFRITFAVPAAGSATRTDDG